jgi:hypothetical protein
MQIKVGSTYLWVPITKHDPAEKVVCTGTRRGGFKLSNGWVVNVAGIAEGTTCLPGGQIVPYADSLG